MSIHAIYRVCVWLPILVPAAIIAIYKSLALSLADGIVVEVLGYAYVGVAVAVRRQFGARTA
jgi:hypothetical protein